MQPLRRLCDHREAHALGQQATAATDEGGKRCHGLFDVRERRGRRLRPASVRSGERRQRAHTHRTRQRQASSAVCGHGPDPPRLGLYALVRRTSRLVIRYRVVIPRTADSGSEQRVAKVWAITVTSAAWRSSNLASAASSAARYVGRADAGTGSLGPMTVSKVARVCRGRRPTLPASARWRRNLRADERRQRLKLPVELSGPILPTLSQRAWVSM